MSVVLSWKKILEQDLDYVSDELKEHLTGKICLIFTGEVGAGKTTFIQHFMKNDSSLSDEILSPTYSIINEQGVFAHADFYRLDDPEEIIHLEMELYAEGKEYFLIEWGMPFIKGIREQLGEQFSYFELEIEVNSGEDTTMCSRNIHLKKLF